MLGQLLAPESRRIAYQAGLRESAARGNSDKVNNNLNNNKILWDSWNNYDKVSINGQLYAKSGDRLYSKHAVDRMQPSGNRFGPYIYEAGGDYGRSVAPQFIEDVINTTQPILQENGNLLYTSGNVKVVTNRQGAVVTVITYR